MKQKLTNILIGVCFLTGLGFLLYPTISNIYNNMNQSKVIASYVEKVANLDAEEYNELLAEADQYNELLFNASETSQGQFNDDVEYNEKLNIFEGNISYIEIPKINVKLPIYHGTSEEKLQVSIGQMENTSFPTGKENTHTVLVGHRGLPSAKLFTNLDKLKLGDIFYINVLSEKFAFKVDQIKVVEPDDLEYLRIEKGKTYATLVTCTPYGINSHRLLVRGEMIDIHDKSIKEYSFEDKLYFDIETFVIISCIISAILMIYCIRKLKFLS